MANITLIQTDTSATYNAGTSGATDGDQTGGREIEEAGTAGSTEISPQLDTGNGTNLDRGCLRFLSAAVIGRTTWEGGAGAAGDYVIPINITTALKDNFIEEVYVDELEDDGTTYANVASATALQVSISTTGVKTITVNRSTNYTPKNADSKLSITVVFQSDATHGGTPFGVTPSETVTTPIDMPPKEATGAWNLPVPTVAGIGEVGEKAGTGAWALPVPTVAGVGEVGRKTATGAWTLPIPTVAGVGEVGRKTATGAWTLLIPTVAGVGTVTTGGAPKTATGAWTLLIPTVAGVGEVGRKTATGAWTIPIPTVAGVGVLTGLRVATGAWTLPVPTVAGVGEVGRKSGAGAWTLPLPTVAGVGEVGRKAGTGAWTLPIPTVAGVGEVGAKTATGAWSLPIPTVAGVGEVGEKTATGAWTLPVPTVAGVGEVGTKEATGAWTLPIPTVAGVGVLTGLRTATGAWTIPIPTVAGVGVVLPPAKTATGAWTLPIPTVDGFGAHSVDCPRRFVTGIDMDGNDITDVGNLGVGLPVPLDFVHFSAAGDVNAFRVDDTTGNVGVGETPDSVYALRILGSKGSSGGVFTRSVSSSDWAYVFDGGTNIASGLAMWGANGSRLVLRAGANVVVNLLSDTTASYIDTGANLLIGTQTDAAGKLQVAGDVNLLTNDLLQARYPVETISSGGTQDDTHEYVEVDTTSGALTRTLPPKATSVGKRYTIKNLGPNTLTVDGDGTETIDTFQSVDYSSGSSFTFMCFASGWRLV